MYGLIGMFVFLLVLGLLFFILNIIFYSRIQKTLYLVSSENRRISPELVWLNLIPILSLFYPFIYNHAFKDSVELEFYKRGLNKKYSLNLEAGTYNYPLSNIATNICFSISFYQNKGVFGVLDFDTFFYLGLLFSIVYIFTFISFFISVKNIEKILITEKGSISENKSFCKKCGFLNSINNKFCLECGIELSNGNQETDSKKIKDEEYIKRLEKYFEMYENNLITKEEFEIFKESINKIK
jgi:hypothetical protein